MTPYKNLQIEDAADNITEVLLKIIEFTSYRDTLITRNVLNANTEGFVPIDLDATEFTDLMGQAVCEHIANGRLLFCDGCNVRFGLDGDFEILPIVDEYAKQLFENDIKEYFKLQVRKLSENSLNNKIAGELIRQKQTIGSLIN